MTSGTPEVPVTGRYGAQKQIGAVSSSMCKY